jgi:hypothetical protein
LRLREQAQRTAREHADRHRALSTVSELESLAGVCRGTVAAALRARPRHCPTPKPEHPRGPHLRIHNRPAHRYERDRPGELIHVDVKKLGRIRPGGGWRVHGRDSVQAHAAKRGPRVGYDYVHVAVDDHSRLAYVEVLTDERGATCAGFLRRAGAFFADYGITVERVMTDSTPGATGAAATSKPRWPSRGPCNASSSHTAHGPTGKLSGSNGPTPACSTPAPSVSTRCPPGYTGTTTTGPTPHSQASLPSAASPTSPASILP